MFGGILEVNLEYFYTRGKILKKTSYFLLVYHYICKHYIINCILIWKINQTSKMFGNQMCSHLNVSSFMDFLWVFS